MPIANEAQAYHLLRAADVFGVLTSNEESTLRIPTAGAVKTSQAHLGTGDAGKAFLGELAKINGLVGSMRPLYTDRVSFWHPETRNLTAEGGKQLWEKRVVRLTDEDLSTYRARIAEAIERLDGLQHNGRELSANEKKKLGIGNCIEALRTMDGELGRVQDMRNPAVAQERLVDSAARYRTSVDLAAVPENNGRTTIRNSWAHPCDKTTGRATQPIENGTNYNGHLRDINEQLARARVRQGNGNHLDDRPPPAPDQPHPNQPHHQPRVPRAPGVADTISVAAYVGDTPADAQVANDFTMGHGQPVEGNLAIRPAAGGEEPPTPPRLRPGSTSNVGGGRANAGNDSQFTSRPAANDHSASPSQSLGARPTELRPPPPTSVTQSGHVVAVGASPSAANEPVHASPVASSPEPHTTTSSGATTGTNGARPTITTGQALRQGAHGTAAVAGVFSVGAGVYQGVTAARQGASAGEVLERSAAAARDHLPVYGAWRQGRGAEAVVQGFSTVVLGIGLAATPMTAGGSMAVALGLEEGIRRGGRALGLDIDEAGTTHLGRFMAAAFEKTIPAGVRKTNFEALRAQEGILKDASMDGKDSKGLTPADYLRNPETRGAYLASLRQSLTSAAPEDREKLKLMVEAADKFVEIEGRRVAKLEPYMAQLQAQTVDALKVQQLAAHYKQNNPTPEGLVATPPVPPAPILQLQNQPKPGPAAQR